MLDDLSGRVAVVTGGGSGIGAALCRGMAERGMRVVVADIDSVAAHAVAAGLPQAFACEVDVADPTAMHAVADRAFATFGAVDLLCNNAGVFQGGLAWERSRADWDWALGVNLYGIIHAIEAFVPRMLAQGTDGHIVNTASVAAFVSTPLSAPYVVSKTAALSLSECLAHDLASVQARIGVSVLVPSAVDTQIADTARVRPDRHGTDTTDDGASTVDYLRAMTATGLDPADVVEPVLDAVRTNTFLVPTKPSYAAQLQTRFEGLMERRLPDMPMID